MKQTRFYQQPEQSHSWPRRPVSNEQDDFFPRQVRTHPHYHIHDSIIYHIILWIFVLTTLALAISGMFYPRATTTTTTTPSPAPFTLPEWYNHHYSASLGGFDITVTRSNDTLSLPVIYDWTKRSNGKTYAVAETGVYAVDLGLSFFYQTSKPKNCLLEFSVVQQNASSLVVDALSDVVSLTTSNANLLVPLRVSGNMLLYKGNTVYIKMRSNGVATDLIHIDRIWFSVHMISEHSDHTKWPTPIHYREKLEKKFFNDLEVPTPIRMTATAPSHPEKPAEEQPREQQKRDEYEDWY